MAQPLIERSPDHRHVGGKPPRCSKDFCKWHSPFIGRSQQPWCNRDQGMLHIASGPGRCRSRGKFLDNCSSADAVSCSRFAGQRPVHSWRVAQSFSRNERVSGSLSMCPDCRATVAPKPHGSLRCHRPVGDGACVGPDTAASFAGGDLEPLSSC